MTPRFTWTLKLVLWLQKFDNLERMIARGLSVSDMRQKNDASVQLADRLFNKKMNVAHVSDHFIDGRAVRVYRNSDALKQKVMVYYHGGGMVLFDHLSADANCRRFCVDNNCVVVNVDYRLAPEFKYPTAHNDAWAALEWVHANIDMLHGDAHKVMTAGDSAGGNLAASMAHRVKNHPTMPKLAAQILIYPWLDMDSGQYASAQAYGDKGYILSLWEIRWFAEQYLKAEDYQNPDVNVLLHTDLSNLPPTFVLTAQYDVLRDEGALYAQKLSAQHIDYPNAVHGFFSMPKTLHQPHQPYADIKAFIAQHVAD